MELGLGLGSRGSDKQVDSLDMPARDRLQCVQGPVLLVPVLVLRMLPTKIASVLKTKADVGQQKAMDDHVRIFFCNCNRSCSPPPVPQRAPGHRWARCVRHPGRRRCRPNLQRRNRKPRLRWMPPLKQSCSLAPLFDAPALVFADEDVQQKSWVHEEIYLA